MSMTVSLLPWEPRVSGGYGLVNVTMEGGQAAVQPQANLGSSRPSGWFAVYEGEFFGVLHLPDSNECQIAILVGNTIWRLTTDVQLSSSRTLTQRSFVLKGANGSITFNYQKLWWNLLRRPGTALSQVVFADDWWGVVCDLPGWVESRWKAGKLVDEIVHGLQVGEPRSSST